jgi:hypothetical protein
MDAQVAGPAWFCGVCAATPSKRADAASAGVATRTFFSAFVNALKGVAVDGADVPTASELCADVSSGAGGAGLLAALLVDALPARVRALALGVLALARGLSRVPESIDEGDESGGSEVTSGLTLIAHLCRAAHAGAGTVDGAGALAITRGGAVVPAHNPFQGHLRAGVEATSDSDSDAGGGKDGTPGGGVGPITAGGAAFVKDLGNERLALRGFSLSGASARAKGAPNKGVVSGGGGGGGGGAGAAGGAGGGGASTAVGGSPSGTRHSPFNRVSAATTTSSSVTLFHADGSVKGLPSGAAASGAGIRAELSSVLARVEAELSVSRNAAAARTVARAVSAVGAHAAQPWAADARPTFAQALSLRPPSNVPIDAARLTSAAPDAGVEDVHPSADALAPPPPLTRGQYLRALDLLAAFAGIERDSGGAASSSATAAASVAATATAATAEADPAEGVQHLSDADLHLLRSALLRSLAGGDFGAAFLHAVSAVAVDGMDTVPPSNEGGAYTSGALSDDAAVAHAHAPPRVAPLSTRTVPPLSLARTLSRTRILDSTLLPGLLPVIPDESGSAAPSPQPLSPLLFDDGVAAEPAEPAEVAVEPASQLDFS